MKTIGLEVKDNLIEDTLKPPQLFLRYFHTIRFLKLRQIYGRVWITIKRTILKPIIVWWVNKTKPVLNIPELVLIPKPFTETLLKCKLNNRKFVFLNQQKKFQNSINWNDDQMEKLWLYNLHYFEYLLPFTQDYSKQNFIIGKSIIAGWIEDNPTGSGNGWESYPLSLRIVNWIFFFDRYYPFFQNDEDFRTLFLTSLYRQARYLKFFLEIHLLANHLFENIKSLLFAAVFFQDRTLFKRAWRLLQQEIREQILEDGGHYERSPMYHSIILADILDVLNIFQSSKNGGYQFLSESEGAGSTADISWFGSIASKMLRWLEHMVHPDGKIALFGDSAFGIAPSFKQLRDYFSRIQKTEIEPSSSRNHESLTQSGYYVFSNHSQYLVIKGGELGVRYQPGHVHCDLFSYEYSSKEIRFIVDSGVGSYQAMILRNKARSVYSHNTVVVNGEEQAELWKIHRVGRWVKLISNKIEENKNGIRFSGQYENSIYPNELCQHFRSVTFINNRFFVVEDQITGESIYSIESLIHFHPQCEFEREANMMLLAAKNHSICILWNEDRISSEIREWFYVPEFGMLINSKKLALKPLIANNMKLGYVITPSEYLNDAREYLSKMSK